ncbi:Reverse transcriptase [Arachis hypogaea]|nr:Reverse transcriptase [Arachis hypogaea]
MTNTNANKEHGGHANPNRRQSGADGASMNLGKKLARVWFSWRKDSARVWFFDEMSWEKSEKREKKVKLVKQRRKTWKLLAKASDLADDPCCFIGDFNDILNQEEKTGNHPKTKNQIEKFRELVNKRELMDIDLKGSKFTWFSNPRDNIVTRERINRALVNWGWRKMFEHVTLIATPAISSDH